MVDSDDEYDRKRRDKFRGERSAGDSYRSDRRDDRRGREEWGERGRGRPDYYRGAVRERYSPGRDLPPPKRMRPDWGEDNRARYAAHDTYGMYAWSHEHYPMHGMHSFGSHTPISVHNRESQISSDMQTQPPMLTLKQFLDTQDDGISDSEVLRKYSEYKLEFKRQQLNEFFVAHKDEEWFKNKYHPEESMKRKEEQLSFLKKRVEVFSELLTKGIITNVSVDVNQADQLLRLLDTVVIKLEGGTEEDLKILDEKTIEISKSFEFNILSSKRSTKELDDDVIITDVKSKVKQEEKEMSWEPIPSKITKTSKQADKNDDEENWDGIDNELTSKSNKSDDDVDNWDSPRNKKSNGNKEHSVDDVQEGNWTLIPSKVKQNKNVAQDDEENWDDDSENISHKDEFNKDKNMKYDSDTKDNEDNLSECKSVSLRKSSQDENIIQSSDKTSPLPRKRRTNSESSVSSEESKKDEKNSDIQVEKDSEDKKSENLKTSEIFSMSLSTDEQNIDKKESENEDKTETIDLDKEKDLESGNKPRALHRTSSIFLRNLAPAITKAEIETICKRYDGFLRVAIADPLVERRWFRRGWVTFQRDVNIKEICWNLNNIRLRECEMGAIVNRDLSRRVRPVNGITAHKAIVRSDIKLLAKIALNLDEKFNLWISKRVNPESNPENGNLNEKKSFGFKSRNPVLQNITDYIIEEASAEEDELLGLSSENNSNEGEILERDPQLIQVLDKLILYMRIVHSVDFYNHCEYPYEDEMPNRCGIIHARGPPPANKITKQDIEDYIKNFETKMSSFLTKSMPIDEEELKNLGCKDAKAEVEKFIQANTQELSKDKWLCPLSGKKFKGPEFIRKHIFNKHMEKVEEVRKEVEYFNNYLKDPKRPQLPEHPGNTKRNPPADLGSQMPYRPGYPVPAYAAPYAAYAPPIIAPPRPRGFGNRRELPPEHQRRIIGYHDLDAPQNFDFFD